MKRVGMIVTIFGFLWTNLLSAKLEDHLRKISDKSDVYKIKNIDFIYMINLDERPEKYERSLKQLLPYGIRPYRFPAVNGWKLSLDVLNDIGLKFQPGMQGGFMATSYITPDMQPTHEEIKHVGQTYFVHCLGRGAIGCYLSHLSVLQDAYDSGYETIWVMEDDIEVIRDPKQIPLLIEKLDRRIGKENWDILFTDRDFRNGLGQAIPCTGFARRPNFQPREPKKFAMTKRIDSTFRFIGARFGAHSMIIRRSGIKKILNFAKTYQIFLPYDMDFYLPEGIRLVTVLQDIVANQPGAFSDNGYPSYMNK
jgi:GR25 family glycosyltransferase involved in LPS biosynthesis